MTNKKLVFGSMFSMLLGSGMAAADWGDVYYCQMTEALKIKADGTVKPYKLEKFQFKLDEAKKSMVFGEGGYFNDFDHLLILDRSWPDLEAWAVKGFYSMGRFRDGKFAFSLVGDDVTAITADCDKF